MKTHKILALAVVGLGTLAFGMQDGTLLRRELKENAKESYRVVSKFNQNLAGTPMGDVDARVDTTFLYTLSIGKVDGTGGSAPVETVTTIETLKMEGNVPGMPTGDGPKPAPVKSTGTIDTLNRVKVKPAAVKDPMEAMMTQGFSDFTFGLFVEFPEKAVKVGDSWEMTIPKGPTMGKADQKLTATLVKEEGDTLHVRISGTLNMEIDPSALGGEPMPMKILVKNALKIQGDALVIKATGQTKKLDMTVDSTGTVDVNEGAMTFPMTGKSTMSVTLTPAAAG